MARRIRIRTSSTESFQDALDKGMSQAPRSVSKVTGAWLAEMPDAGNGVASNFQVELTMEENAPTADDATPLARHLAS